MFVTYCVQNIRIIPRIRCIMLNSISKCFQLDNNLIIHPFISSIHQVISKHNIRLGLQTASIFRAFHVKQQTRVGLDYLASDCKGNVKNWVWLSCRIVVGQSVGQLQDSPQDSCRIVRRIVVGQSVGQLQARQYMTG